MEDAPVTDRRTRSRQRRHEQLYRAAVELFIEQGYHDTTMEQIADRADFARATVFNYFPRKTAFLDEWTSQRRARARDALANENVEGWSLDRILHRYMTEMARMSLEAREETRALLSATLQQTNFLAHPLLADELADIIRGARAAGEAPDDIHAGQAGLIIATAYFAVLNQWISSEPSALDLEKELLIVVNLVLYGIYSPRQPLSPNGNAQVRARKIQKPTRAKRAART